MSQVKPIPDGYHSVTPYLSVRGAEEFMEFARRVFGAEQVERHDQPDGKIMHAEVRIGDSMIMLSEACGEMGPTPGGFYLYVEDPDGVHRQAVEAGAVSMMEPADMFWGDRIGGVKDAFGNVWWIARHIEDVDAQELGRRAEAFAAEQAGRRK